MCYKVIRNRVQNSHLALKGWSSVLFSLYFSRVESSPQNEQKNLGVKTVYLVISHPIEEAW